MAVKTAARKAAAGGKDQDTISLLRFKYSGEMEERYSILPLYQWPDITESTDSQCKYFPD